MAYKAYILEDEDYITEDLYIRPLSDDSGFLNRRDDYYAWTPISEVLGEYWYKEGTKKVKDLISIDGSHPSLYYEFMRKCSA